MREGSFAGGRAHWPQIAAIDVGCGSGQDAIFLSEVIRAIILMLKERIASQSEVIRAIVSGYSPCYGGPHRVG